MPTKKKKSTKKKIKKTTKPSGQNITQTQKVIVNIGKETKRRNTTKRGPATGGQRPIQPQIIHNLSSQQPNQNFSSLQISNQKLQTSLDGINQELKQQRDRNRMQGRLLSGGISNRATGLEELRRSEGSQGTAVQSEMQDMGSFRDDDDDVSSYGDINSFRGDEIASYGSDEVITSWPSSTVSPMEDEDRSWASSTISDKQPSVRSNDFFVSKEPPTVNLFSSMRSDDKALEEDQISAVTEDPTTESKAQSTARKQEERNVAMLALMKQHEEKRLQIEEEHKKKELAIARETQEKENNRLKEIAREAEQKKDREIEDERLREADRIEVSGVLSGITDKIIKDEDASEAKRKQNETDKAIGIQKTKDLKVKKAERIEVSGVLSGIIDKIIKEEKATKALESVLVPEVAARTETIKKAEPLVAGAAAQVNLMAEAKPKETKPHDPKEQIAGRQAGKEIKTEARKDRQAEEAGDALAKKEAQRSTLENTLAKNEKLLEKQEKEYATTLKLNTQNPTAKNTKTLKDKKDLVESAKKKVKANKADLEVLSNKVDKKETASESREFAAVTQKDKTKKATTKFVEALKKTTKDV